MTLRRMLFVLGAVLIGVNALSAAWDIRIQRAFVERNALRDFNNLTKLLADQTARSLESTDVLLRGAASDISTAGLGDPAVRTARLRDRISGIPQIRAVLLLDRDGRILVSTDERTEIGADYSSRTYFIQQRDATPRGRYVSEPFLGVITHRWSFAVSEAITDRGRFAGVLAAIIDVEYFNRLYRSLDIGDDAFVTLINRGGVVVTRVPPPPAEFYGKRRYDLDGMLAAVERDSHYAGWWSYGALLKPRLISAMRVADAPLIVVVGAPEAKVLAPWRTEAMRVVLRTLLTSAVMLALLALTARELTRRAEADARVQENRRLADAEQDRLQKKLRQAEKMEAVGRLAGGIAHDFNNNLGSIIGYGEMLQERAAEGSPEQRYARNLMTAANRSRDLVDQILTYSRSQRVERKPIDIGRVVRETLEVIRGSVPGAIDVELALPEAPLVVVGNATQLHQVVMNLCTNAIHSMAGEGKLAVSLEAIDLERELAFAQDTLAPGRYVKLVVVDTGTGMDSATLAHIFEPFFTTKEVGRGTGLGLSLVYGIVTDSGGATHVTSELGRGSTFEVYLPRADPGNVPVEQEEGPVARGHGERVLLVDDEKPLLIMTAELLTGLGYDPAPFSEPHAALASLEAMPTEYDVVLTDEAMPGLTGTTLARAAKKARPTLPVILISGHADASLTQAALQAGVREVLRKPVQSRELAAALARALAK